MGAFETLIQVMLENDVFRVLFPWMLTLAVTYGALDKYDYFEDDAVNGIIALSAAFLAAAGMFLFVPQGLFANFMAAIAFIAIGALGIVITAAVGGVDFSDFENREDNPIAGIALLLVPIVFVLVFIYQFDIAGLIPSVPEGESVNNVLMPALVLLFMLLVVLFTAGQDEGDEE